MNTRLTLSTLLLVFSSCTLAQQYHNTYHGYNAAPTHHGGYGVSRQFAHFSGPVSGAEREVVVARAPQHAHLQHAPAHHFQQTVPGHHFTPVTHHHHGAAAGTSVDYVARPNYKFGFGVEDSKTGNKQSHQETRDGDVVRGQYSVLEPDGSMRIVEYTADATNGFQAVVKRAGHPDEVYGAPAKPKNKKHYQQYNDDDYD